MIEISIETYYQQYHVDCIASGQEVLSYNEWFKMWLEGKQNNCHIIWGE